MVQFVMIYSFSNRVWNTIFIMFKHLFSFNRRRVKVGHRQLQEEAALFLQKKKKKDGQEIKKPTTAKASQLEYFT